MNEIPPDSAETIRLLGRHAAGDSEALAALLRRHQPHVRQVVQQRLSRRLRPRLDPSDVVQETFMELHNRLGDFLRRRPMPFRLWLIRMTHQQLCKVEERHVAAAKRTIDREVPLPERSSLFLARRLILPAATASKALERSELAGRMRRLMAALNTSDREMVLLRNFDSLSNAEAACVLGIEPESAKKRYARALLRLQRLVIEEFSGEMDS